LYAYENRDTEHFCMLAKTQSCSLIVIVAKWKMDLHQSHAAFVTANPIITGVFIIFHPQFTNYTSFIIFQYIWLSIGWIESQINHLHENFEYVIAIESAIKNHQLRLCITLATCVGGLWIVSCTQVFLKSYDNWNGWITTPVSKAAGFHSLLYSLFRCLPCSFLAKWLR